MPFAWAAPSSDPFAGGFTPQVRQVDTGDSVIDLASMRDQFERSRAGGKGGEQ